MPRQGHAVAAHVLQAHLPVLLAWLRDDPAAAHVDTWAVVGLPFSPGGGRGKQVGSAWGASLNASDDNKCC